MENRRNCALIIVNMLEHVPSEKTEMRLALKKNLEDANFRAPEMVIQWDETSETLHKFIPYPKAEWEFKILGIYMVKTQEELKTMFPSKTES